MSRFIAFLIFFACATTCLGEIHHWVDAEGKVHYTDQPPPATAKEEKKTITPARTNAPAAS